MSISILFSDLVVLRKNLWYFSEKMCNSPQDLHRPTASGGLAEAPSSGGRLRYAVQVHWSSLRFGYRGTGSGVGASGATHGRHYKGDERRHHNKMIHLASFLLNWMDIIEICIFIEGLDSPTIKGPIECSQISNKGKANQAIKLPQNGIKTAVAWPNKSLIINKTKRDIVFYLTIIGHIIIMMTASNQSFCNFDVKFIVDNHLC